jgi:hypothetical protein
VLSYRVMLDVPFQLAVYVSEVLAEHRGEIGTRRGTRKLTCWKQPVFVLAWFRDRPDILIAVAFMVILTAAAPALAYWKNVVVPLARGSKWIIGLQPDTDAGPETGKAQQVHAEAPQPGEKSEPAPQPETGKTDPA